ncbi:hypothetical protein HU200_014393 [Digitaria exilis]|uniref:F-box domain-containing protein n=1 Tax=Digitaria exilis TaxID=1010633 RepID=A0A835FBZ0_9POAL|nr:hypothetical protein HU200_014393 [Digitaria exilis]
MGNQDALPDAILELVLLCLESPLCLLRAASTCKRWRRIIASDAFLGLHGRPSVVAGSYYNQGVFVVPRFEPSPSTATVDARHFSLDFLPGARHFFSYRYWRIMDSCGSLLLFREDGQDLIVCEPLPLCLEVIPPPKQPVRYRNVTAALLNGDDDESNKGGGIIGMSSFRVLLCLDTDAGRIRAWMFSSRVQLILARNEHRLATHGVRHRARCGAALDQNAFKFSSFVLPNDKDWDRLIGKVILAVGRDGEARIVVHGNNNILKIFARQQGDGRKNAEEWALEKNIHISAEMLGLPPLPWYNWACGQHEDAGMVRIRVPVTRMSFCLDMETMEMKRLPDVDYYMREAGYPSELPWPPSLCA